MDFLKDKIRVTLENLDRHRKAWKMPIDGFSYMECEPKKNNDLPDCRDPRFAPFTTAPDWKIKGDQHAWFYKHLVLPEEVKGQKLRFEVWTGNLGWNNQMNPQFIAYVDGKMVQGMDVNHISIPLGGKCEYELYLYAYAGYLSQDLKFVASVYVTDELCEKVYYDILLPYQQLDCLNPLTKEYADILEYLNTATNKIDLRVAPNGDFRESLKAAEEYLETEFYGKYCHTTEKSVITVGHTHIDCAWKWTFAQTREKVQRSFSNMLTNMQAFPEFIFMQSQPLLYQFTKEEAPELYEQIKEKIKEGRWEPEGAMWVEPDCNLPSGESFVRQLLYGKQFFRDEFGVESKVFWEPDVFGYSAALPQILRKSGVEYFVTSKLGWNEKNRFPYDIFKWRGIDGTEINSYFLTSQERIPDEKEYRKMVVYSARMTPKFVNGSFHRMQQKNLTDEVLMPFGKGDGGGGPNELDLEGYRRLSRGLPGCVTAKNGFVGDFLKRLFDRNEGNDRVPTWDGELYFELHRGCLTSIEKNKRNNRICEFLYPNIEQLAVLNRHFFGSEYPQAELNKAWLTILTNQFHDVIPGSSIKEVYDVSDIEYAEIIGRGSKTESALLQAIADKVDTKGGVLVYNPHSAVTSGNIRVDGELVYVDGIPAKGWKVVTPKKAVGSVKVSKKKLENEFFIVELDDKCEITRLYDKKNAREVLKAGHKGNRLVAYEDIPFAHDAWEISEYYTEKSWNIDDVQSVKVISDGVRSGIRVERKFLSSTIGQNIWLYENTPKIDFETDADWHEHHLLIKTLFDTDIHTNRATYNIQFGNIERSTTKNTSWDTARFEVLGHKYADLSEGNYGVALMNDCKYGYNIHDGVMGLSLIKCATDPYPEADIGEHKFTYSIYPHAGTVEQCDVEALAYEMNKPLMAVKVGAQKGSLPESFSMISVDQKNIIIETVKKAEKDDATIVRMYECTNSKTPCKVTLGIPAKSVKLCDLQENELETLEVKNGTVALTLKPYEILTLKIN